jgi:transcriptional regulator of acetoin/glycerol metabolism
VAQPAQNGGGAPEHYTERDILYKILFDMRKDVTDLKQLVFELMRNDGAGRMEVFNHHRDLFREVETPIQAPVEPALPVADVQPTLILNSDRDSAREQNRDGRDGRDGREAEEEERVEDIEHSEETESLLLEHKEKEMILKALARNQNKRKYAARDLGISERTLYRKLKQYAIDETE